MLHKNYLFTQYGQNYLCNYIYLLMIVGLDPRTVVMIGIKKYFAQKVCKKLSILKQVIARYMGTKIGS
jgi:hypothetical protein